MECLGASVLKWKLNLTILDLDLRGQKDWLAGVADIESWTNTERCCEKQRVFESSVGAIGYDRRTLRVNPVGK